jgi:hypothetical protein
MRAVLYPLIAILELGSAPFTLLPAHQEFAAVLSGVLITSLIGVAYLSLPLAALTKYGFKRRSTKRLQRVLAANLALSLTAIAIAEIATLGPLMVLGTISTALSTLLLSALITSGALLQLFGRRAKQVNSLPGFAVTNLDGTK